MAGQFNPYHVWLGIPPEALPANYYRLLGLRLFEDNPDVIDNAADRQSAHLRTFQSSKNGSLAQDLLNEVAAARICLLDPKKKAVYDQQLRAKAVAPPPQAAAATLMPDEEIRVAPIEREPDRSWQDFVRTPTRSSATPLAHDSNRIVTLGIAAAVAVGLAVGIILYLFNGVPSANRSAPPVANSPTGPQATSAEGVLVFNWPDAERYGATVTVDDAPINVPSSGPWEIRCPSGSRHVTAERTGYTIDEHVWVTAGASQIVPARWQPTTAIALYWPPQTRDGAQLTIDGAPRAITLDNPLLIPTTAGLHQVHITYGNNQIVAMSAMVRPNIVTNLHFDARPARLVLLWPESERQNVVLTVDGQKPQGLDEKNPAIVTLPTASGRHVVRITRPGYRTYSQTIWLAAGRDTTLRPYLAPLPPDSQNSPEATSVPPTQEPDKSATIPAAPPIKLEAPADDVQQQIAKQIDQAYGISAATKDLTKAGQLYATAEQQNDSGQKFVMLAEGAKIAAAAANWDLLKQGIDKIDAEFQGATFAPKQKLLHQFLGAAKPNQVGDVLPLAEQLLKSAIAADEYEVAMSLATTTIDAATKSELPDRQEIKNTVSRLRADLSSAVTAYQLEKRAQATLDKNSADPAANLNVGRWLCLYKGNWAVGLPHLAQGNDPKLKSVALREISAAGNSDDVERQLQLADSWWDAAQRESSIPRDAMLLHAGEIYRAAMPNVASAARQQSIERRLATIDDIEPPITTGSATAEATNGFPIGQWVDVLKLIDTARDTIHGQWSRQGSEISGGREPSTQLQLPVAIDGGYDLEVQFTRTEGSGDVAVTFPVGAHQCNATLSGAGGKRGGLYKLGGKTLRYGPRTVYPSRLENGRRYTVLISVRLPEPDRCTIDMALDGQPYVPQWAGDPADCSVSDTWQLSEPRHVGLCQGSVPVTWHSVRLRMVSGQARPDTK